ncbi:MAG: AEC family transporter [Lachnospiraceae bacterium]|nr:AEC family transporter [Lachnospiraceae bacterium]
METTLILLQQVLIMFLLATVGFIAFRSDKISNEGSKTIGNLLIYISLPSVIIKGFLVERTTDRMIGLLVSMAASAVILSICVLVSRLCFKKDAIASFGAAFSNPGFFGIPLLTAILNDGAVFYIAPFIAFLNLLQWSYGVSLLTGKKTGLKAKQVLTAPFMIAIAMGLILFFSKCSLPAFVTRTLDFCAGLNTPLAMFAVGVYLAQCSFGKMLKKKKLYAISAIRLLLIPLIALALLTIIPGIDNDIRYGMLISAACPVGSNLAVYAQLHNKDYTYAVEAVAASTLFCIITIPLFVQLAGLLWCV